MKNSPAVYDLPNKSTLVLFNNANEIKKIDGDLDEVVVNCTICLSDIDDKVIIDSCCHQFCKACILFWCERSNKTCPLCRDLIVDLIGNVSPAEKEKHLYSEYVEFPMNGDWPVFLPPWDPNNVFNSLTVQYNITKF